MTLVADSCPPKGNAKAAMTAESDNTNSCSLTLPLIRSLQRLSCHVPQCLLRDCIELVLREQQEEKLSNVTCGTTTETASSAPGKQLLSKELSQKFLLSEMLHTKKGDPSGPDMTTKLGGQQDLSVCPSGCACPSPPSSSNKKGDDTIIYSRDKLMETLATVERMLEEDFSDSGDEGDSYTTDSSYIASRSGHSITSRSGKCTETSEEEEDNSFSSYEEELSDLDEEDDEDHCSEDDSEDVNGMGESNQGTAVLKQRRAQRLSEASTPSQKDHTTVKKLRQGRLVARTSSFESARSVESENSKDAAASTPIDPETTNLPTNPLPSPLVGRLPTKREKGALLFVDMSGFTALSTTLELEPFSKVIHAYFQRIVDIIHQYGGDIQKFAGDAVFALWSPRSKGDDGDGKGPANDEEAALAAAMCAVKLVDLCSDFTVDIPALDPASTSTATTLLNIYAAVGFGDIVTTHVGGHGSTARMEYVLLGDTIRQVSEGLRVSKEGEAVISAEVVELLERDHITLKPKSQSCVRREDGIQVLAYKNETFFLPKNNFGNLANLHTSMQAFSLKESQAFVFEQCQYWTPSMLEKLKRYISPYVHSVVVSEETNAISQSNMTSHRLRGSLLSPSVSTLNEEIHQEQQSLAELRDVCSIFIQPDIPSSVLMGNEADDGGLLDQLNRIMLIISSEVDRFDAHLKQFIVDDKGIVAIFNFGLRGR